MYVCMYALLFLCLQYLCIHVCIIVDYYCSDGGSFSGGHRFSLSSSLGYVSIISTTCGYRYSVCMYVCM